MSKLKRRRNSSMALENRQMFAADLYQVFVPLDEAGLNDQYQTLLGGLTDSGSLNNTPLSGNLNSTLRITVQQDGTEIYYDHAEDGYDLDPIAPVNGTNPTIKYGDGGTLKAGDVIELSGAAYNAGDRITATAAISVTRLVDDTGFLGSSEAVLVSINPDANVGESFSLALLNENLTDRNADLVLRDSGLFVSTYSDTSSLFIIDLNGRVGLLGTSASAGEQLFFSDADLQSASIEDVSAPGQFLTLTNGWRSVQSINTDLGEQVSVVLASGNSDLGTSYFLTLVADENLGSDYFLPVPDPSPSADGVLDNQDLLYLIYTDVATELTIDRPSGAPLVVQLAAGETYQLSDLFGAVKINSRDGPVSVYGLFPGGYERTVQQWNGSAYVDYVYPNYYSSGWAFAATPAEFNAPEVQLKPYGGINYWLAVTEDTTISVSETSSFSVIGYGSSPTVEQVVDDATGLRYHTFKARSDTAYWLSFSPIGSDGVRLSTSGNADISVVAGLITGTSQYGFGDALPNSGGITLHREFYESGAGNDADGFVELSEQTTIRTSILNNSGADILVDNTGSFVVTDDFDKNSLTSAYSISADNIVSITLYDELGIAVTDTSEVPNVLLQATGLSLSTLRTTGYDLRSLFATSFVDDTAFELNIANGYRVEITYDIIIDPTLDQSIVDADYALMGSSSFAFTQSDGHQGSGSLTSPLVIEVPETPSFSIDYMTVSEDASVPIFYLRLAADPQGMYLGMTDTSTEIIMRSTQVNTGIYQTIFANTLLNGSFSLAGQYGVLTIDQASSQLDQGLIAFIYTKYNTEYNQSGASSGLLYDQFSAELRNDFYKYDSTPQRVTITDTGINGTLFALDGVALDANIDELFEDDVASLTGNILDQFTGLTAYDSGNFRLGYVSYNRLSGENTVSSARWITGMQTITTRYGTLSIAPDGNYSYSVLPERTQFLAEGQSVTENISFRIGDSDYSSFNSQRYLSQTLSFQVKGSQDIQLLTDETQFILDLPENGALENKQFLIQAVSGVNQIIVDWDGNIDGLGDVLLIDEIRLLSIPGVEAVPATDPVTYTSDPDPIVIDTGLGILTISDFYYSGSGEEATLVYSYVPKSGAVNSPITDLFGFIVQDQNLESLSYDFSLNLIPAISEAGPSILVEDKNGAVLGDYTVIENESSQGWNADTGDWDGITVHIDPGSAWKTVLVEGVPVVEIGRFYDGTDPDNIFSTIGRQITGTFGTLTMQGGNKSAGELYFSYLPSGDTDYDPDGDSLNHGDGAVLDQFSVTAIDLLNLSSTGEIEVLVGDTYPSTEWDYFGDATAGVLTEDDLVIQIGGAVLVNDTPSLDSPNQVIGVKSLDLSGGGLFEFASPDSVFVARADDGEGVLGLYGTLWMDRDGNFTYELDNSRTATQALTETKQGVEQFAYTLADKDADANNNPISRSAARLYIYIDGMPDPEPEFELGSANTAIPVPENGTLSNQKLIIATNESVDTLVVGDTLLTASQLLGASAAQPISIEGECGTFVISGFNAVSGELTFGFIPAPGASQNGCSVESVPITVTDTYGESQTLSLEIALSPPRVSDVPPITRTDLLATDGSETLVRAVYLQQIGTSQVQPTRIVLTDPSDYYGADLEQGPIVDDRTTAISALAPNQVDASGYEALLDIFEEPQSFDRRLLDIAEFETDEYALIVQKNIPPQLLSVESRIINYVVPSDTFLHTDRQARISMAVTMLDGTPLPEWLEFEPNTATFSGAAPEDVQGEFLIKIVARDNDGKQAETVMRLIVEEPEDLTGEQSADEQGPTQTSLGRQGFSDQLAAQLVDGVADAG